MFDPIAICVSLANFLDTQAELFDLRDMGGGWARHLRRDAELLRMRARRIADENTLAEELEASE